MFKQTGRKGLSEALVGAAVFMILQGAFLMTVH